MLIDAGMFSSDLGLALKKTSFTAATNDFRPHVFTYDRSVGK